ncbi:hypothetical protein QFZ56_005011 [Streptomyces achromogenes]|uniref:Uncharacterized protein n=1 Tax=Streptomyces achromogenes TaxID=67255 RepID=A0ABU0Q5V5_STRAH|nr:hypothetical protein [Streptomyces achromogenes]
MPRAIAPREVHRIPRGPADGRPAVSPGRVVWAVAGWTTPAVAGLPDRLAADPDVREAVLAVREP